MRLASPKYILERPDLESVNSDNISNILKNDSKFVKKIFSLANQPKYVYWDKYKHKPVSGDLTLEEQWMLVSFLRDASAIETPIKSYPEGNYFKWIRLPNVDENLHQVDMLVGGGLFPKSRIPRGDREIYISRGVIEEAIASSQLEGAHTTRVAAKKMILEKIKPKNKSEQMIVNNYQAMLALEDDFKTRKLSKSMLFELHSVLTDKTIDKSEQGRFRRDKDEIVVEGDIGSDTYTSHIPPQESFLDIEIERLILYANDELQNKFVHPLIKAIFLHFWVGYLHPFTDGNGRLARALFYWYLLKKDYWTFSYIPISTLIKKSPVQYAMAYIYTEQDREDLTYFFDYQMRKISQAIADFGEYLTKQSSQNHQVEQIVSNEIVLNDRQRQLIFYFLSESNASTTTGSHATLNNVSRQTAAKDLSTLFDNKLIKSKKDGKYVRYYASDRLKKLSAPN